MRTPPAKSWTPSVEEFAAWREDPVTRWILAACGIAADDCKRNWIERSWQSGQADQDALTELRVRADAYQGLIEADHSDWLAFHEGSNDEVQD